jgi:hypothetical protein
MPKFKRKKEISMQKSAQHFSMPKSSFQGRLKMLKSASEAKLKPQVDRFENTILGETEAQVASHEKG